MTSNLLANYRDVAPRHIVAATLHMGRTAKERHLENERRKASAVPLPGDNKPLQAEVGRHE